VKPILIEELQNVNTKMMRILRIWKDLPDQRNNSIAVNARPGIRSIDIAHQQDDRQRSTIQSFPGPATSFLRELLGSLLYCLGG
jgi:hypothetical protein